MKGVHVITLLIASQLGFGQILIDSVAFTNTLYGVDLSEDASMIFLAGKDSTCTVWKERQQILNLKDHTSPISSVHYLEGTETILTGSYDNSAILWDLKGNILVTLTHEQAVIKITQNDQYLATVSRDQSARIWSRQGELLHSLTAHSAQVNDIQFVDPKKWIVTGSFDKSVKIWDYNGTLLHSIDVFPSGIRCVAISLENDLILAGQRDGTLSFVNLKSAHVRNIQAHALNDEEYKMINSVQFYQNKIISGGSDGYVRIWDLEGNMISELLVAPEKDAYVSGLAISKQTMITSSGGGNPMMKVWDLSTLEE